MPDLNFKVKLIFVFLFLWFQIILLSQSTYQEKIYTTKDGLSSELCRSMFKDHKGFLWISTNKGLNRFDGNSFYTFRHRPGDPNSLSNNNCNGIFEDSKGQLWVNTDDGLSLFDREKQTFKNYYPDTTVMKNLGISYTEMAQDHEGKIWIGGYYDVLIFDPKTEKFERSGWFEYTKQNGIFSAEMRNSITQSVIKKSHDELWLLTVYGLFSVHTPTKKYTYHPNPLIEDYFAFAIKYIDHNGVLWIGTYDQCFYTYDPKLKKWDHFTCPKSPKGISDAVLSINKYDQNTLMVTRLDHIYLFNTLSGKFEIFKYKDEIHNFKNSLLQTLVSEDDIFITQLGNQPFINLSKRRTLVKKVKLPIPKGFNNNHSFSISKGKVLTGDWNQKKVIVCDSIECKPLKEKSGNTLLGSLQLYFQSKNGEKYFSTSTHVYKWHNIGNMVQLLSRDIKQDKNIGSEFRNFVEDNRGNIYVRERNKGIYVLKTGKDQIEIFDTVVSDKNFSALHYDATTDKLWLASENNGLYIIDPLTHAIKNYKLSSLAKINRGYIQDIVGDHRGNIFLLIVNYGFIKINSKDMIPRIYTTSDGLLSDDVKYGCISNQQFWFTSGSGLMAFDYTNERFYSFDNELDSKLFNYRIFADDQGNITQNLYPENLISFDVNAIKDDIKGEIYLKEVKLSGVIIPIDSIFTVNYQQNNFVFLFGRKSTKEVTSQEFKYRINGQSWQSLENRSINLYNMMPGLYSVDVVNKFEPQERMTFKVIVLPPWWKTNWFYSLSTLLIIASILMIYKKRIATVRKQENEKNLLKQRIAEIEMTALRAQMNPHFIFNCLNSINRFILSHETEAASAYLTKFSRLIRMILDGSREDFITLDKELDALKLYIEMESMRFQAVFDWRININQAIQIDNIMIPSLILQPYVENAIWHGLMQTPAEHPKKLTIQISQEKSVIIIEIEDNGVGRQRAFEIKSKNGNTHKSHGIALTEERLKLMNKLKNVKTNITIEDLVDQDLKPSGTKVRLYFYI